MSLTAEPVCRIARAAALVLALTLPVLSACGEAQTDIETIRKGVVRLVFKAGSGFAPAGAGFLISSDGHVLTALTQVWGREVFVVPPFDEGKSPQPAKLVWKSDAFDMAVVLTESFGGQPISISDAEVTAGKELYLSGYPERACCSARVGPEFLNGSVGRVVELARTSGEPPVPVIMHSVKVHAGNNGGPLLDSCGGAIGIANLALDPTGAEPQAIFFGAPLRPVLQALRDAKIPFSVVGKPCRDR